jgi:hypothetical protein
MKYLVLLLILQIMHDESTFGAPKSQTKPIHTPSDNFHRVTGQQRASGCAVKRKDRTPGQEMICSCANYTVIRAINQHRFNGFG